MSRISLLTAGALALALAAPAYSQTGAAPGDDSSKPTQMERSAPADKPAGETGMDKSATPEKDAAADKATTQPGGFITQQATSQQLAENFIGMKVESPKKESIGKVSDLILDDQNRIVGAVLSVGGFLGVGAKNVAVSWNELQLQGSDTDQVATVNLTKEQLQNAPEFKSQADLKAQQEAERRKLEQPARPATGGGTTGMGGGTTR
jgi:hypothetical protein